MTERPASYQDIWDELAAGRLSTTVLAHLMRTDEVFRAWCIRKHDAVQRAQRVAELSGQLHEQYGPAFQRLADSDEDMA